MLVTTHEQYMLQKHLETKGGIWHPIDPEDVSISRPALKAVQKAAYGILSQIIPEPQWQALSTAESVVLLGQHLFWEEHSGMLYLCSLFGDRKICLNVPAGQWKVRENYTIQ